MSQLGPSLNKAKSGFVLVKWSTCSPSTPTIRVQISLKSTVFVRKNEKEAGVSHFRKTFHPFAASFYIILSFILHSLSSLDPPS